MNQTAIFEALLSKHVPLPPNLPVTFLEIAQMPHYEVVISRIYQFYLKDNPEHGFKDLFLVTLLDLIKKKWVLKNNEPLLIEMPVNWDVQVEVSTKKGNRIDILVEWADSTGEPYCIVIENKVFHVLRNELQDYIDTPEAPAQNKVGVFLTLNRQEANHTKFINITHDEWLEEVKKRLGEYLMDGVDRHLFFIRDFILNLSKFTKNRKYMSDFSKFYFDHTTAIEQLVNARNIFVKEVFSAYQAAGDILKLKTGGKRAENYQYLILEEGEIFFTLVFNPTHYDAPFTIVYEVQRGKLAYMKELREAANNLCREERWNQFSVTKWYTASCAHIVAKSCGNFDNGEDNLVNFFENEIKNSWQPMAEVLKEVFNNPPSGRNNLPDNM